MWNFFRRDKKITFLIFVTISAIIALTIFMKQNKTVEEHREIEYGEIEEIYGDDISMAKLTPEDQEWIKRAMQAKRRGQINRFLDRQTQVDNTEDEKFEVYHTKYQKSGNKVSLDLNIINLTDNRKKKITVTIYDMNGNVIGSRVVYQNSLAKSEVNLNMDTSLKKGYFGSDIDKVEIKAEAIEEDYLPWEVK